MAATLPNLSRQKLDTTKLKINTTAAYITSLCSNRKEIQNSAINYCADNYFYENKQCLNIRQMSDNKVQQIEIKSRRE